MTPHTAPLPDLGQVLGAALSLPSVSLVLAVVIAGGILLAPRGRSPQSRVRLDPSAARGVIARYTPEHRTLGIVAIGVIVAFITENLLSGYVLNLYGVVSWWRYATPVFAASLGLAVLLVVVATRGSAPAERPVIPAVRRTWLSFSTRVASAGAVLVVLALAVTTIAAGLASSNIGDGPYVYLEIAIPNETIDPVRPWFYGWAYGVPVLVCLVALAAVAVGALHSNAVRAFLRPETVVAEQRERRDVANGITRVATGAALLALAGAWRFIADAGSTGQLSIQGDTGSDSYEAVWRYADLAIVGGWLAPALEIVAFVLLILVAAQLRGRKYGATTTAPTAEVTVDAEAAR